MDKIYHNLLGSPIITKNVYVTKISSNDINNKLFEMEEEIEHKH